MRPDDRGLLLENLTLEGCMKKIGRFTWILPGLYLIVIALTILGDVIGAGHLPSWIQHVFFAASLPCYVVSFLWPKSLTNAFVNLILCLIISLITYAGVGLVIDAIIRRYRQ